VRSFGWPGGTQVRPVAEQFVHAAPCLPHAVPSVPGTQVFPTQQPAQLPGPHEGVPRQRPPPPACAAHVWPLAAQLWQEPPFVPHAVLAVPGRH
jgi:hypothetical protein